MSCTPLETPRPLRTIRARSVLPTRMSLGLVWKPVFIISGAVGRTTRADAWKPNEQSCSWTYRGLLPQSSETVFPHSRAGRSLASERNRRGQRRGHFQLSVVGDGLCTKRIARRARRARGDRVRRYITGWAILTLVLQPSSSLRAHPRRKPDAGCRRRDLFPTRGSTAECERSYSEKVGNEIP